MERNSSKSAFDGAMLPLKTQEFKKHSVIAPLPRLVNVLDLPVKASRSPGNIQMKTNFTAPCGIAAHAQVAHKLAHRGIAGHAQPLPHLETIQSSFGRHAVTSVKAFIGGPAKEANEQMGSTAFASGGSVAFKQAPNLHTAAHEAAHIVQQRAGVHHTNGIGKHGDHHETHADAVASAVVRGESTESRLDQYCPKPQTESSQVQYQIGSGSDTNVDEEVACEALRSAFDDSIRVIALYREFLAGSTDWESVKSQTRMIGNAAQGVAGAGENLHPLVQVAIEEVESFGSEELQQMGALLWEMLVGDEDSNYRQWVRNEIDRQKHYNTILIRLMYENGCPDFPGTWRGFQEQVLSIGTRGSRVIQQPGTTTTGRSAGTRTALAWVEIQGVETLLLATEIAGARGLEFVRWINNDFRTLALQQARARQGSVPSVSSSAVRGLPSVVPDNTARR